MDVRTTVELANDYRFLLDFSEVTLEFSTSRLNFFRSYVGKPDDSGVTLKGTIHDGKW